VIDEVRKPERENGSGSEEMVAASFLKPDLYLTAQCNY
jgi:hypothetical protein